jgi:hypothetical protein
LVRTAPSAPIQPTSGPLSASPITATPSPISSANHIDWTAWCAASRWSPAPSSRLTAAVVPYARKMNTA